MGYIFLLYNNLFDIKIINLIKEVIWRFINLYIDIIYILYGK